MIWRRREVFNSWCIVYSLTEHAQNHTIRLYMLYKALYTRLYKAVLPLAGVQLRKSYICSYTCSCLMKIPHEIILQKAGTHTHKTGIDIITVRLEDWFVN